MSDSSHPTRQGRCLCGAVRYRAEGPVRPLVACHCGQCRRATGNYVVATAARRADLIIEGEANLTWFTSSPGVRRGFCRHCGANLFWDRAALDQVSIMAGSLDQPTGLAVAAHIFVADKADYTRIEAGPPTYEQGDSAVQIEAG